MGSGWLAAFAYEYDDLHGHVEEDDFPVGVLGNITFGQAEEFAQLFNVGPVDKRRETDSLRGGYSSAPDDVGCR